MPPQTKPEQQPADTFPPSLPPRHSRESGNPEAANQARHPKSCTNRERQIPSPSSFPPRHSRESGNPEAANQARHPKSGANRERQILPPSWGKARMGVTRASAAMPSANLDADLPLTGLQGQALIFAVLVRSERLGDEGMANQARHPKSCTNRERQIPSPRHSRESGNPEAANQARYPKSCANSERQIPSPRHSRESGNPEAANQARPPKPSPNRSQRIPSPFTGEG